MFNAGEIGEHDDLTDDWDELDEIKEWLCEKLNEDFDKYSESNCDSNRCL